MGQAPAQQHKARQQPRKPRRRQKNPQSPRGQDQQEEGEARVKPEELDQEEADRVFARQAQCRLMDEEPACQAHSA
jgi:hypothetical protein